MDAKAKVCKQCGKLKPLDNYRHYYGGRTGTYRTCLECERINTREKYLRRKDENGKISATESAELEQIHKLYQVQRAAGLQPPRQKDETSSTMDAVTSMLSEYAAQDDLVANLVDQSSSQASSVPPELSKWLTEPLHREPEYYQEDVYEELREKYRPMLEINKQTMMPVYDDTYRAILDQILARFDEYEDAYYA